MAGDEHPEDGERAELAERIVHGLARRHSTATVLLHHAAAERLGLGPTDHKCLDLLREHGGLTGSRLAALTGLTSGAVSGVVARLERAGHLRREPDPDDGRKQLLRPVTERVEEIDAVFGPLRGDMAELLAGFDGRQLAAIAAFLTGGAELSLRHAAQMRAHARAGDPPPAPGGAGPERKAARP
ncbi:MarR family winged helix-turn-helix transcriptional regulator [Actinomadura fibrosa]|uniref:MarR family winged helix-turn-helix transcriptional regulator n=1 Tax=Actinomadura fibrosa TaxID=111802 RepID=A0ABW2XPH9_9ACTN|nr:MarR family transcriptional regulator [Actinomadura fibrosa]